MKVYKIELMVLDHENFGQEEIEYIIRNIKYLHPSIVSIDSKDIGEWTDDHPLNKKGFKGEFKRLFNE